MTKQISYATAMFGLTVIGDYENHFYQILTDEYEFEIKVALYKHNHSKLPESEEILMSDEVTVKHYESTKDFLRSKVQQVFDDLAEEHSKIKEREDRYNARQNARHVSHSFRSMNKPAPEGTVDELAKKFNVSKSHIRTLKREGRLNELVESQNE